MVRSDLASNPAPYHRSWGTVLLVSADLQRKHANNGFQPGCDAAARPPVRPFLNPVQASGKDKTQLMANLRSGEDPQFLQCCRVPKPRHVDLQSRSGDHKIAAYSSRAKNRIRMGRFRERKNGCTLRVRIYYDRFADDQIAQLAASPPLVNTPSANYTTISNLLSTPLSLSPNTVWGLDGNWKPLAVYNWSFGIQQNIGLGTILDVAYIGNVNRHGMQIRDLNATPYGTNFLPANVDKTLPGECASTFKLSAALRRIRQHPIHGVRQ